MSTNVSEFKVKVVCKTKTQSHTAAEAHKPEKFVVVSATGVGVVQTGGNRHSKPVCRHPNNHAGTRGLIFSFKVSVV